MTDTITDQKKYIKGWTGGLPETPCGFGSKIRQTAKQREWIPQIIKLHGIITVADIGAGDLNWINQMTLPLGTEYSAYDLVPRQPSVKQFNVLEDDCPKADLLMVLWVINHFPVDMMKIAIDNVLSSGSKYLLMTYDSRLPDFMDLPFIDEIKLRAAAGKDHPDPHNGLFMRLHKLC